MARVLIVLLIALAGAVMAVPAHPAASQPASPAASPAPVTSLFELTLTPEIVPDWTVVTTMTITLVRVPPATTSAWDGASGACCPGPKLKYLLAGTFTVVGDGPLLVLPSEAEAFASVPAGTEVVLGPGDLIVTRNEHGDVWTNTGAEPVALLSMPILSGYVPGPPLPSGWVIEGADIREGMALPPWRYTLRLERQTLAPEATVPAPADGVLQWGTPAPNQTSLVSRGPDGSLTVRYAKTDVTAFILTLTPTAPTTGTPTA